MDLGFLGEGLVKENFCPGQAWGGHNKDIPECSLTEFY